MAESGSSASGYHSGRKVQELAIGGRNEILPLPSEGSSINDKHMADVERKASSLNLEHSDGTDRRISDFRDTDGGEKTGNIPEDASVSPSGSDGQKDDNWKYLERCIVACIKGFAIGSGLRGGLALVTILSRLKKRKPSVSGKSDSDVIRVALKETLRYGLFVGTFAGSYCIVDESIAAIGGGRRTAKWRSLVAGAVAGPSLMLTGPEMRHTSMAIYILMRASVLAARCGIKSKRLGPICRPLTWKHGDTFLMCLSSTQILYAWIMHPKSLPSSYIAFLNKHGGKDTSIVHAIRALALRKGLPETLSAVTQYYQSKGVKVDLTPDVKLACQIVHGDQCCEDHFFSFIKHAYLRALPVYLPVYLVPALLVHREGLFARPFSLLSKTLLGTARSSLFLATYCTSAWLWTCWAFRAVGHCSPTLVAVGTFPTGLAVLIEKKSRRMELALYCFSRAIESFGICVTDSGLLKKHDVKVPNRVDIFLFSIATSIIMHCYAEERDVFRSKYLNVLDWVFGIPDPTKSATPTEA